MNRSDEPPVQRHQRGLLEPSQERASSCSGWQLYENTGCTPEDIRELKAIQEPAR